MNHWCLVVTMNARVGLAIKGSIFEELYLRRKILGFVVGFSFCNTDMTARVLTWDRVWRFVALCPAIMGTVESNLAAAISALYAICLLLQQLRNEHMAVSLEKQCPNAGL